MATQEAHETSFPALIRRARERAGLTQAQLAERCGVTQVAVSFWENVSKEVQVDTLRRVAKALRITMAQLVSDEGKPPGGGRKRERDGQRKRETGRARSARPSGGRAQKH